MKGALETRLAPAELQFACEALLQDGGRMQMAWAWVPSPGGIEVCYLATQGAQQSFVLWRCSATDRSLPSLAGIAPLLGWYEREITDLFGVSFTGHPEPYPLVLQEGARPIKPPLDPAYPGDTAMPFKRQPARIPEVLGDDVQALPFGPVRADVMESAQFLFFYLGEHILHYQPRLFFKHRGMEKRFEGLEPALGVVLAERVSGVGSFAHALAYCQAIESACDCAIPPRAEWVRTLLAEFERLYNHLHYFGHLADTTTLKVANAEGELLEERVKQINARLCGSRLLRNLLRPGGLRRDVNVYTGLSEELQELHLDISRYLGQLSRTAGYLDRLIDTGVLNRRIAFDQGATGPVERASGLDRDLRRDHAYAAYGAVEFVVPLREKGDANARAEVRAEEIGASMALIEQLLADIRHGALCDSCTPLPNAEGLGWCESPRGALYYAVHFDEAGKLRRVKIKSPSFSNWRVFPYTVHDSNMMDYAINEASFGLSIAGCDR
ncbi:MAG: NADH-quinone oxidoreductase subunit D-related protein [Gammaproteobacteria bacterium]